MPLSSAGASYLNYPSHGVCSGVSTRRPFAYFLPPEPFTRRESLSGLVLDLYLADRRLLRTRGVRVNCTAGRPTTHQGVPVVITAHSPTIPTACQRDRRRQAGLTSPSFRRTRLRGQPHRRNDLIRASVGSSGALTIWAPVDQPSSSRHRQLRQSHSLVQLNFLSTLSTAVHVPTASPIAKRMTLMPRRRTDD